MKQISDHVYQIPLGFVNAFVIEDSGLTLVDTGTKGSAGKIFRALTKAGKKPADIKQIILTHAHPDHAGSAAEIQKQLNIPVHAHAATIELITQGISGRNTMHLSPGIINWLVYNLAIKRATNIIDPVIFELPLTENDILPVAGGTQIIETPGHSEGHISLLVKKDSVLIAADICAHFGSLTLSTVYEDKELGIESLQKVAKLDFDKAVFGHGSPLVHDASKKFREKFASA